MRWRRGAAAFVLLAVGTATADDWRDRLTFTASDRARGEFADYPTPRRCARRARGLDGHEELPR